MVAQRLRSPAKFIGGKASSAQRIIAAFPAPATYDLYCEPCGGGASVLLARPIQWGHAEVYNDLENNLYAFWSEMQANGEQLQEELATLLPFRALYKDYYRSLFDGSELTRYDRALRYFYCLRFTGTGWLRKSPVGWDHRASNVASYYSALEVFESVQQRFKYVSIDNRDVLATVKRYDSPRTLCYLDPPYFGAEQYYETSKKGFPHTELATLLNEVKGYVALSYYSHPEIERHYPPEKWHRVTWQQHKSSQVQLATREEDRATELLLTNYPTSPPLSLWTESEA